MVQGLIEKFQLQEQVFGHWPALICVLMYILSLTLIALCNLHPF